MGKGSISELALPLFVFLPFPYQRSAARYCSHFESKFTIFWVRLTCSPLFLCECL